MAKLGNEIIMALEDSSKPITASQVLDYCPSAPSLKAVKASLKYRVKSGLVEEVLENGFSPKYRLIVEKVKTTPVQPITDPLASIAVPVGEEAPAEVPIGAEVSGLTAKEVDGAVLLDWVPASELDAMLAENKPLMEQHAYLRRSLDHSQKLLDEYLESVTDPLIFKSLKGMRDLAILQLEQLVEPTNEEHGTEEHGTSGIVRSGTG